MADRIEKTGNPIIDAQQERVARASGHDKKRMRLALGVALAVHLVFLAVKLPDLTEAQPPEEPEEEVYVVHQVKFRPPPPPPPDEPPPPEPEEPPPPEATKIPIPDPEPQEPEPVVEPEPEPEPPPPEPPPRHEEVVRIVEQPPRPAPPQDLPTPDVEVTIPDPPPAPPPPEPTGPIRVGGNVKAPVKVNTPDPEYTESARAARVEGVVIIETIIDKRGRVRSTKIVKDQPMGLGAAAERAVKGWTFKPATLNGKPVEVYYNLTVNFQLD